MKKRILSLFLALLMMCSIILTSCSDEKTDDEKRKANAEAGDIAYQLSVWVPTNVEYTVCSSPEITEPDTFSEAFLARLEAVEAEINAIISSDNTKIELVAIPNSKYDQALSNKFSQVQSSTLEKPYLVGNSYVNEAIPVIPDPNSPEDYFYQLQFKDVLPNQIDICLIRDYSTYASLATGGALRSLNSYITSDSASYPRFKKMIKKEILDKLIIGKDLYAVPNNRSYATDAYKYILINKELVASAGLTIDTASITSILDCEEIISKIADLNVAGVIPFVGTEYDAPGIIYWGDKSLVVSNDGSTVPMNIFDNESYMSYIALYKVLKDKNQVKSSLAEGEKGGVIIYDGSKAGAEAYAEDYYLINTGLPVMTEEDVFGSMFAISEYSINFDRAMSVLYLLNTNSDIKTLLQYGVEDQDYIIETSDETGVSTIKLIKDANGNVVYDMNNDYTGNGYITYREEGSAIDDWEYIKSVNYDATISNFLHFKTNYLSGASAEKQAEIDALTAQLKAFSLEIFEELNTYNAEQFLEFQTKYKEANEINIFDVEKKLAEGEEKYNTLKPQEQEKKDKKEANNALIKSYQDEKAVEGTTDERKQELDALINDLTTENTAIDKDLKEIENYDALLSKKADFYENTGAPTQLALKVRGSETLTEAVNSYRELQKTYNK